VLFKKNYGILDKTEIKKLVDIILKKHNSLLNETLENK
jgi:hypothetical protein